MAINNSLNNAFVADFTAPNKVSKNLIIGGNFTTNPWQRGTTASVSTANTFVADRFRYVTSGAITSVFTYEKYADSPTVAQSGIYSTDCLMMSCTTSQASITAGQRATLFNTIEGFDFTNIAQRTFTLSFWVKSNLTGTYCVAFKSTPAANLSYIAEYTINAVSTWEYKTITVIPSPSAGAWNYTNSTGLSVVFCLFAGSTFQTTPNAWNTGDFYSTANQVNFASVNTNTFQLALVQVEPGAVATPFEQLTEQEVLLLCQRYYQKTFIQSITPAQASGSLLGSLQYRVTHGTAATTDSAYYRFKVLMRTSPTFIFYNPINAAATFYNVTNAANSGAAVATGGARGVSVRCSQLVTDIAGNLLAIHIAAQAEL